MKPNLTNEDGDDGDASTSGHRRLVKWEGAKAVRTSSLNVVFRRETSDRDQKKDNQTSFGLMHVIISLAFLCLCFYGVASFFCMCR